MSRKSWIIATLILGVYVLWNLIAWGGTPAEESWDSYRYLSGNGFTWNGVFHVMAIGITTPFLYGVVQDPTVIGLLQVASYGFAWSILALVVVRRLRGSWIGWLLLALLLAISMQNDLWSWNHLLVTESLVFTTAVLWLAALIWMAESGDAWRSRLGLFYLSAVLVIFTRPLTVIVIVPISIIVIVWWARREHHALSAVITGSLLAPVAVFGLIRLTLVASDAQWHLRYALHNLVEKTPSFRAYALTQMPPCDLVPSALNGPAPWNDAMKLEESLLQGCPETFLWFKSDATSLSTWVRAVPREALANWWAVLPSLTLVTWTDASALPSPLGRVLLPGDNPWPLTAIAAIVGILLAILARVRVRITWGGILSAVISALCVSTFVFIAWASDGIDLGRHVFPVIPLLAVALLVLPVSLPGLPAPTQVAKVSGEHISNE